MRSDKPKAVKIQWSARQKDIAHIYKEEIENLGNIRHVCPKNSANPMIWFLSHMLRLVYQMLFIPILSLIHAHSVGWSG